MVVRTGRSDVGLQARRLRGETGEVGVLAAETVEDVEDVVCRPEREITELADAEDGLDRSRVRNVASVNGVVKSVVIHGRLGRPPDDPHGGRRVLLTALTLTGGRGLIGALLSGGL